MSFNFFIFIYFFYNKKIMKKGISAIGYILIAAIGIIVLAAAFPWGYKQVQLSLDRGEINMVKSEFMQCSEKILETTRTGDSNKCMFSVSRGDIYIEPDGIYYKLVSSGKICDEHEFALIDFRKKIWQKCKKSGDGWIYELRWLYPKNDTVIIDGSVTITLPGGKEIVENLYNKISVNVGFEIEKELKGKTIELTRKRITPSQTILEVKVY